MQTVRDEAGNRYLLLKRSRESCLVRDPQTGAEQYVRTDQLEPLDGTSPLDVAASGVPEPVRRVCTAVSSERALGFLLELVDRGPVAVRDLLSVYDLCESDLHGLLGEFTAAGLIEETTVAGERGYRPTGVARDAVAVLRTGSADSPGAGDDDDDELPID